MVKYSSLKYLPFAWSGLIFTLIIFGLLGFIVKGDPRLILKEWNVSVDVFAMIMHEIGLLFGLTVTLHLLSKRGIKVSDLGLKGNFKVIWIVYAVAGFVLAILLYRSDYSLLLLIFVAFVANSLPPSASFGGVQGERKLPTS